MINKVKIVFGSLFAVFPLMASAAEGKGLIEFLGVVKTAMGILVPILVTLALIYFIYGLAEYVLNSGNEAKKAEGKNIMTWGIIAMFCIVSIWGIVRFIGITVGIDTTAGAYSPAIPEQKK